jgi:CheY-like chemotaxis protein
MQGLIIEDSPLTAKVIGEILKYDGYSILIAKNGQEGLQYLEDVDDIDFVISDIEMPEMDGLSFLQKIRLRVEWEDLPVILLTSWADASTVQKAATLGCNHFLVKPPDEVQIRRKVKDALEQEEPILLHRSLVIQQYGFNTALYEKLLGAFVREIETTIQAVEHALSNGEADTAGKAILGIQESARILGANRLEKQFTKLPKGDNSTESCQVINRQPAFLRELKALQKVLAIRWHPER